jgi:hypothetical protein
MSYTALYEGDSVSYVGDALDGIEPASGTLMYFASRDAAHVRWTSGARAGQIDLVDVYDLMPTASQAALQAPIITTISVRRVMNAEGEEGVINFLARAKRLDTWEQIAHDALQFVQGRLKVDASLDLAYEQLHPEEVERVVALGAQVLLRDAFTGPVEESA